MASVSRGKYDVISLMVRLGRGRKWTRSTTSVCLTPWIVSSPSPMKDCSSIWKSAWPPWRTRQGLLTHLLYCRNTNKHTRQGTKENVMFYFYADLTLVPFVFGAELSDSGSWELPETTGRIPPHQGLWFFFHTMISRCCVPDCLFFNRIAKMQLTPFPTASSRFAL